MTSPRVPLPCVPCRPSRRTIRKSGRGGAPPARFAKSKVLGFAPPSAAAFRSGRDAPSAQSAPRFDSGSLVSSRAAVSELGGMCGALVETGERACGRAVRDSRFKALANTQSIACGLFIA